MIYPVGSVYVSMLGTPPPFADNYIGLVNCTWKQIDKDCTLWSTASADLPASISPSTDPTVSSNYVSETLPKLPDIQCEISGSHVHRAPFPDWDKCGSHTQYSWAGRPTYSPMGIQDLSSLNTKSAGAHGHKVSYKSAVPEAYQDEASVRPRGFKCSMWVRVA